ncbi:gliding motility-associated C-terminal domain-containing protein [Muricauda oceani]|uniref:Gliding motility-associated C-terminal domain-containing protein n=1 Tax=Flagellimonas oceani TaxID=2698672 RepID=A0A6G7J761_9FLAO|nr:gliding motility-associated C-terminal domain-containing protein [Allomuricauda oceani]MBW8242967.1 gliding motility-associated C-terminal domain-containing protein [Allomuricauda oceani]QII46675.1 gliding motility-associated C-terminal domain-containing protein [Allomuricauda oceani]
MSLQQLKSNIWLITILFFCLTNCSSDGSISARNSFKCCTEEIDDNVNNLPLQENGELVDIYVSNVLTPNGDGINDFWVIENLYLYPNNTVEIYNSSDQLIFTTKGYDSAGNVFPTEEIAQGSYRYKIVIESEDVFLRQGYLCVVTEYPNNFNSNNGCQPLYPDPFLQ